MPSKDIIGDSITGKFRQGLWCKYLKGVKEYSLVNEGDKVAVCVSGGKSSMLMAKCIQKMQKYSIVPFEAEYFSLVSGTQDSCKLSDIAKLLDIPVKIFEESIPKCNDEEYERQKLDIFFGKAREAGCNKIALGENYDDVIETVVMGMLYNSRIQTILPTGYSEKYPDMRLIRPMYFVREADINAWTDFHGLDFQNCSPNKTDNADTEAKRTEVKQLLKQLRALDPKVDKNIFRSMENVNLKTLISYRIGDEYHHFLDDFDAGITHHGTKAGMGR